MSHTEPKFKKGQVIDYEGRTWKVLRSGAAIDGPGVYELQDVKNKDKKDIFGINHVDWKAKISELGQTLFGTRGSDD